MTELPTHVDIRDVSLRDGLQIEDPIPLSAKLELLAAVAATGVREMEATAFVSPSKVPALADAAELAAELHRFDHIEFSALVASPNGAKRAIAAGLHSIEYVVSAADGHSRSNVGRSTAEATALIAEIVAIAHDSGVSVEVIVATAWDCPFDGPTPPQRVLDIVTESVDRDVDRLAIADTIGTTTPRRVSDLIALVRPLIGDTPLGAHFHNTRGAGLASAYAAVSSGVTRLDASVGGLGGCPFAPGASGNIATEDLIYLLRDSGIHVDGLPLVPGTLKGLTKFAGSNERHVPIDRNNWAPRLGFAYQLTPNTVVRAGAGVYYGMSVATNFQYAGTAFRKDGNIYFSKDGTQTKFASLANPFPDGMNLPPGRSLGALTFIGLGANTVLPENVKPSYHSWNFSIQRQLPGSSVIEVNYTGTKGTHLFLPIGSLSLLNPQYWGLGRTTLTNLVANPFYGVITDPKSSLSAPTIAYNRLLRAYPQYNGASRDTGMGEPKAKGFRPQGSQHSKLPRTLQNTAWMTPRH